MLFTKQEVNLNLWYPFPRNQNISVKREWLFILYNLSHSNRSFLWFSSLKCAGILNHEYSFDFSEMLFQRDGTVVLNIRA